jgi:hypothetical protein
MRSQLSANVFVRYNNGHSYQEGMFASPVFILSAQSIGHIALQKQSAQDALRGFALLRQNHLFQKFSPNKI